MHISREIQIDAGHRIPHHGGMCRGLHGHRYRIVCHVVADVEGEGAEADMAMDFGTLKRIMMEQIHRDHDHALILTADDPLVGVLLGEDLVERGKQIAELRHRAPEVGEPTLMVGAVEHGTRFCLLPHQPTAERLAEYWGEAVHRAVQFTSKKRAFLSEIEVWETPNCCARWAPPMEWMDTEGED